MRLTTFALVDCRWPMKCQRKASPYSACFASRSCARFSPTTSTPASARTAMSDTDTYFVAATMVTFGPTSSRIRAYCSRTSSGDITDHSLSPRHAAVTPVREEVVAVARRAQVDPLDCRDARFAQGSFGRRRNVEVSPANHVGAEPRAICLADVLADLVAARSDPWPDHRLGHARAKRCHAGAGDPFQQPEPAGVEEHESRRPAGRDERDRQTVGGEFQERQAGLVGPEAVPGG